MMKLLHLLLLLTSLASSRNLPPLEQTPLIKLDLDTTREKVPGDNPAYYSREKKADQLFSIEEFTISPNPVIAYHRIFFYLRGTTGTQHLPGLSNANLSLYMRHQRFENSNSSPVQDSNYTFTHNISDFKVFTVRKVPELEYGGPLVPELNEMVGDLPLLNLVPGKAVCVDDVEAVARLPDGRVLFAFEARVGYKV